MGRSKFLWDRFMICLLSYIASYAPYSIGFVGNKATDADIALEIFMDLCIFADLIICFQTPYQKEDKNFEFNKKKIVFNYLGGYFLMDFLAIYPSWLVMLLLPKPANLVVEMQQN